MNEMGRRTPQETGADRFGRHLRTLRKDRHWTQAELAEKIDVDPSMVCNYERGIHYPPVPTLLKLAEILDVSLDRLMGVNERGSEDIQDRRLHQLFLEVDRMDAGTQGLVKQVVERIVTAEPSARSRTGTKG